MSKKKNTDGLPIGKRPASQWYWADWLRDPAVRASSLEAKGLWMDMLALMHEGSPYGHLTIGGQPMTDAQLARMVGESPSRVKKLLAELERNGVFSRTEAGVIYSRRMVRDEHIRNVRAEAGKLGGNPNLIVGAKDNPEVTPKVGGLDKQIDKQKPTPSSSTSSSSSASTATAVAEEASKPPQPLLQKSGSGVDTARESEDEALAPRDRFVRRFYATATAERQAEIRRQLAQVLKPEGLLARRGDSGTGQPDVVVKARDERHLNQAISDLLRGNPIRNHDRAIWVLFKKLGDPPQDDRGNVGTEIANRVEDEKVQLEERYNSAARRAGQAWAAANRPAYEKIIAEVEALYAGQNETNPFTKSAKEQTRVVKLAKAAGFPTFEDWLEEQKVPA
jgi:DNA-binding Lrp family transcriptional regulator